MLPCTRLPAAAALALAALAVRASPADQLEALADAQARIQYAVYTQDAGALRAARQDLEPLTGDDQYAPLALYYLGYVDYRLAQLASGREDPAADGHLDGCIEHGEAALDADRKLAEVHALIAACRSMQAVLSPLTGVLDSRSAESHLRNARELAPDNPRVELLAAIERYRRAPDDDPAAVMPGFERALELFAGEDAPRPGWPDWGLAEAHAYLGSLYLASGDLIRARNELERALIIAPDYAWALDLISSIQPPLE